MMMDKMRITGKTTKTVCLIANWGKEGVGAELERGRGLGCLAFVKEHESSGPEENEECRRRLSAM